MKKSLLTIALIASLGMAHATTGHDTPKGGQGHDGYNGGGGGGGGGAGVGVGLAQADAAAKAAADAAAIAAQQQAQRQAAEAAANARTGDSTSAARTGDATAQGVGGGATGNGLNGSIGLTGGATTNNTRITTLVLPALPMGPALPPMTTSSSTYERTACMPNKIVWREPVVVLVRNSFGPDEMKQVGWDESLRPAKEDFTIKRVPVAYDQNGEIIYRNVPYGTQALIKTDLMNAASGSSFAFGGIGKSAGAQAAGTDQGAVQRYVTAIQVFECPIDLQPAKIETRVEVERKPIRQ